MLTPMIHKGSMVWNVPQYISPFSLPQYYEKKENGIPIIQD